MKSLTSVQKIFGVFRVLAKAAMILSFVWAGLALAGVLCGVAWYSGGTVLGADPEAMLAFTKTSGLSQMLGALLADVVFALTDAVLFLFAFRCFRAEQAEGTPFTFGGAERIRKLGISVIVMPIVATIVAAVLYECFGVAHATDWNNLPSVVLGVVLLLLSPVFRYGAELEEKRA